MPLTDKQIINLRKLDAITKLEIMHVCANDLALVSVCQFEQITGEKRRTIYKSIADEKKLHFELSGHVFPAINDK